jgi:hypothetical protein
MALNAGDTKVERLDVDPFDGTTVAVLQVTAPDATTSTPDVTSSNARATWTANVTYAAAGTWILKWTVTGTGAGVEAQEVLVAPLPALGRTYAHTGDLAGFLHDAPPTGAQKLLEIATEAVDDLLLSAVYDVDDDGMPTAATVITALRDATCAQVEWWGETDDPLGAAAYYQSVSAGGISLTRGSGSDNPRADLYAGRAVQILRREGLLGREPWSC